MLQEESNTTSPDLLSVNECRAGKQLTPKARKTIRLKIMITKKTLSRFV